MPRQMNVNAAYHPVGGKHQSSIKCSNFCISLLFSIFIVAIFMVGTGSNNEPHHEFQPGQATQPPTTTTTTTSKMTTPTTTTNTYPDTDIDMEEENIQLILEEATEEIQDAETEQLAVETKAIDTMTTKITNQLRVGIGKLFGSTLSNDEMDDVAVQVQTQLKNEAQTSLRKKADTITNNAIAIMGEKVTDADEMGTDESTIEETLVRDQKRAVNDIKYGIDNEYNNIVQTVLPNRAIEIEKAILEERLSAKLGKRVKLVIDDDNEISNAGNDDELFNGLNTFTTSNKPKTTSSSSSSSGITSTTGSTTSSASSSSSSKYGSTSNTNKSLPSSSSKLPTKTSATTANSTTFGTTTGSIRGNNTTLVTGTSPTVMPMQNRTSTDTTISSAVQLTSSTNHLKKKTKGMKNGGKAV